ncbi:MAG: hypothetical protein IK137_01580 [Bacilli bacterium]|nr:hypothetical protein [Bacilli bacterium]
MKKYILLIFIFIILSIFIKVPKYNELNNIKIIDKVYVYCDSYKLREILLDRDDLIFEYKYYKVKKIDRDKYYINKSKIIDNCK